MKWTLIPEQTLEGRIRPDGVARDDYFARGYWEAKGPKSDLEKEIAKKIADGYPLTNTLFENTRSAVLYQSKKRLPYEYDLTRFNDVSDLLQRFINYTEPDVANFETAVNDFKESIPEQAAKILALVEAEQTKNSNPKFIAAFGSFRTLCQSSLDPKISDNALKEMLVQHLLTERLFRTIFDNSNFVNRNVIAVEVEKVIQALTSREFISNNFLRPLDRFYVSIERAAKDIDSWSERQHFLNTVYERFFQGFSVKQADTLGIVYTPQEIVDFMCESVEDVLQSEFGTSIANPGVQILDPATGTGSFIVNILHRIPRHQLKHKYRHDLFCNEVTLLPYYIASLNIEHEYFERAGEYEPFEGICFADTLTLADDKQLALDTFAEKNTKRVEGEKDAEIMIVMGNPPYNVGQKNENDNNKNRKYSVVDARIKDTYVKDLKATLKTQLYDAYVRFFRWATDRLQGRDGIVCYVSNNSFVDQIAFDGVRKHLLQDFTQVYHLDLHGNVRRNPKLSGTTHNVFGIQVGVGITIAIRSSKHSSKSLYYYRVPEYWRKQEKLSFLATKTTYSNIDWLQLEPDGRYAWITDRLQADFNSFIPVGTKEAKSLGINNAIFRTYSGGVKTNRDTWVYDFDAIALEKKIVNFINHYSNNVNLWKKRRDKDITVDDFVEYDDKNIKWSEHLKMSVLAGRDISYSSQSIRYSLYRPFTLQHLYFDPVLNDRRLLQHLFFPTSSSEKENVVICLSGVGSNKLFHCLCTSKIPGYDLLEKTQCFPFYSYSEDGHNRSENVTNWVLTQFQAKYGEQVTKWDIFHYVYGLLHHPQYRERYAENLRRDLPYIPFFHDSAKFTLCANIGKQLMDIHLNYESAKEYNLTWLENENIPFSWRVEQMRLSTDKRVVVVNESLRLGPLPQECFQYQLGNRSALEWVIDQYQVTKDKRSGIESDPNRLDDEEYIVRLVCKVVQVSVETVQLVNELAKKVTVDDWTEESVNLNVDTLV